MVNSFVPYYSNRIQIWSTVLSIPHCRRAVHHTTYPTRTSSGNHLCQQVVEHSNVWERLSQNISNCSQKWWRIKWSCALVCGLQISLGMVALIILQCKFGCLSNIKIAMNTCILMIIVITFKNTNSLCQKPDVVIIQKQVIARIDDVVKARRPTTVIHCWLYTEAIWEASSDKLENNTPAAFWVREVMVPRKA